MAEIKGIKTRWWVIGGVGAAGVVWWVYKRQQASAAAAAATTQDPNIDPNTGLPYSSEYGGSGYSAATGVTPSLYGYMDQFGNLITPGTGTTVTAPSTNAAWVQQSVSYMQSQGSDAPTVLTALGLALAGATLSNDQFTLVQTVVGAEGQPPQGWPNGVPHQAPPTGQGGGSSGVVATRKDNPGNTLPITVKATEIGWNQVAQDHYTWDTSKYDLGFVGSTLAHYNAQSGLSSTKGKTVVLPAKLYVVGG